MMGEPLALHVARRSRDEGLLSDGFGMEGLASRTVVTALPGFDSPRYGVINPRAPGFAMFRNIRGICATPAAVGSAVGSAVGGAVGGAVGRENQLSGRCLNLSADSAYTARMKVYLVGGAVRDRLMGRPVVDRDWVVVGGTPEALLAEGYQAVGAGFPVFLHPVTREEYALARTERRIAPGHKGFATWYAPDVTLEDDLRRRDLTINAIAMTPEGEYIDPYGGREDLEHRWLRAVSPAFVEDPLRVLRVARFAATLPGFRVHPDTLELMRHMVRDSLLDELPAERVWHELDKASHGDAPDRFLDVIRDIPAFDPWFPEWRSLGGVAMNNGFTGRERLALWCESLPQEAVRRLCARLKAPHPVRDFLLRVELAARLLRNWRQATGDQLVEVLERVHAFHPDSELEPVTRFLELRHGIGLAAFRRAAQAAAMVRADEFDGVEGRALGEAIRRRRAAILDDQRSL